MWSRIRLAGDTHWMGARSGCWLSRCVLAHRSWCVNRWVSVELDVWVEMCGIASLTRHNLQQNSVCWFYTITALIWTAHSLTYMFFKSLSTEPSNCRHQECRWWIHDSSIEVVVPAVTLTLTAVIDPTERRRDEQLEEDESKERYNYRIESGIIVMKQLPPPAVWATSELNSLTLPPPPHPTHTNNMQTITITTTTSHRQPQNQQPPTPSLPCC